MLKKYYVYALLDPRKNLEPFYIGKGSGRRAHQHLTEECSGENPFKDSVIDKIRASGHEPIVEKIQENMLEKDAFIFEKWLISFFGRRHYDLNGILTNLAEGGIGGSSLFQKGVPKSKETRENF